MKKNLFTFTLALFVVFTSSSQTNTVPFQFYLDANNNCNYDSGEPLIYNLAATTQLQYKLNNSQIAVTTNCMFCVAPPMTVNNYSTPATNTFVVNPFGSNPSLSAGTSCTSYTNLVYGSMNYLPIINPGVMSIVNYLLPNGSGTVGTSAIAVCPNDSIRLTFSLQNAFTCSAGISPRTYSLYMDGVQYDLVTTTGLPYTNAIGIGTNNYSRLMEGYGSTSDYFQWNLRFPSSFNTPGNHTLSIQSSPVYNHSLSVLNFTCLLSSMPCSNLQGEFFADCNNNCIKDLGDGVIGAGVMGIIANSTQTINFYPNQNGQFSVWLPNGNYTLTHTGVLSTFTACTSPTINVSSTSSNTFSFGYKVGTYQNPGVSVYRNVGGTTNPGNTLSYLVHTNNSMYFTCSGSLVSSGSLKVKIPPFMTYAGTSSTPPPTVISAVTGDTLVWTVSNYYALTTKQFSVTINNTISLSTQYTITATINPSIDNYTLNNICHAYGTIGAPYDPNDKISNIPGQLQNGDFTAGPTIYYTINFQNVGTAPAVNVKTLDTLDANLDLNTLVVLQSSFPVKTQINHTGRLAGFYFEGINLPDDKTNEPASHGFVRFQIDLKPGVPPGTVIKNRAHNYFDFTEPVATNQTSNKLVNVTVIDERHRKYNVQLMPNPVFEKLSVSADIMIRALSVVDVSGKEVLNSNIGAQQTELDLQSLPTGIYIVKIFLENGEAINNKILKN